MKTWKFEKLRKFCKEKIKNFDVSRFDQYWDALCWKISKAEYHIDNYKNVLKEYNIYMAKKGIVRSTNAAIVRYMDSVLMEIESLIETLNSLFDILAQIINLVILDSEFTEGNVNLATVKEKIKNKRNLIFKELKKFDFSDYGYGNAFEYIRAFCNTIKHRKLILATKDMLIDFTNRGKIIEGIRFAEFSYKGKKYGAMWVQDIIDKYGFGVLLTVSDFGIAINKYLKKRYHLF